MINRDFAAALAVNNNGRIGSIVSEKGTCKHCEKFRNVETGCFEIIGFPLGWGSRGRDRGGLEIEVVTVDDTTAIMAEVEDEKAHMLWWPIHLL